MGIAPSHRLRLPPSELGTAKYNRAMQQRRRGRRSADEDTRRELLEAARTEFTERGYDGTTVRGIAARAGVDPSMINHWFGGKHGLFADAVLRLPVQPREIIRVVLDGPTEHLGERIVRQLLRAWDAAGGGAMTAMVRSISDNEAIGEAFRDILLQQVFVPVAERLQLPDARLRATLCASQVVGLLMVRYVLAFEPLASAQPQTLVDAVAPNLQRYLTGSLDG